MRAWVPDIQVESSGRWDRKEEKKGADGQAPRGSERREGRPMKREAYGERCRRHGPRRAGPRAGAGQKQRRKRKKEREEKAFLVLKKGFSILNHF